MNQKPKCKTQKFPENNRGENTDELGCGHDFLDTIPKAWCIKETFDKLDFFKIKNFWSAKDNVKRIRRQATDWEKIFARHVL